MNKFSNFIEKYKFGILAVFAAYIFLFVYLQLENYTQYYPIEPFYDGSYVEIPKEVEIKPENIELPEQMQSGEVKNIVRDQNDKRKMSKENWNENESAKNVEQSVKDYEKRLFEQTGGAARRKLIEQQMEDIEKHKKQNSNSNSKNENNSGGNTAYEGSTMVEFSLSNRSPHQNKKYWVRNPGYTCGIGVNGVVVVKIKVNQNGDVIEAQQMNGNTTNACVIEQAIRYAKMSRFNYSSSAPKIQEGTITYSFISQ